MNSRREFLSLSLALGSTACRLTPAGPRFEELSLAQVAAEIARGRMSAQGAARQYLARIAAIDPQLHAVIEVNPDAMRVAAERDAQSPARRGPLHGVPILIKDNIDTADRMQTTAGSLALTGAPAPERDAALVARLRVAGAVILGKTNLSEWANIRSSRSTSGWSARGGQTHNPHALDRNPSGSSSGSGAAVAASLCAGAVGTETDGSIVSPASINGIVGLKPTVGLISGQGIIPISHSQDTAGPMTRTVEDAALLLSAMNERGLDYRGALKPGALRGARIGIARSLFGRHPGIGEMARRSIEAMTRAGAVIVDPIALPETSEYGAAEFEVLLYELKANLNAYLAGRRGAPVKTLAEVIAFNEREAAREMPHFGQENLLLAEAKGPLTDKVYLEAREKAKRLAAGGIDAAMEKDNLTAIAAPTDSPAWLTDYVSGDHYLQGCSTPAAVAGYPHITVPAGLVAGLPVGWSFFGRAHSEETLLGLAHAFESATRARRAPRLTPHATA